MRSWQSIIGDVRAGERSAELREAEIELHRGQPGPDCSTLQHLLFPAGGLRFSEPFKSGARLSARRRRTDRPASRAPECHGSCSSLRLRSPSTRRATSFASASIRSPRISWLSGSWTISKDRTSCGLACSRLRSAFCVFTVRAAKPRNGAAQWGSQLARSGGRASQGSGCGGERYRAAGGRAHPGRTGPVGPCGCALAAGAATARSSSHTSPRGARAQAFLIDLAQFVETRGWLVPADFGQTERLAAPVVDLAASALNKRWKKVSKAAHGLETLTVEQRHDLAQGAEDAALCRRVLLSLVPGKAARPVPEAPEETSAVFGDLNDAATVRAMLTGTEAPGVGDPAAQRAIGWVIGASQARAEFGWADAKALWGNLHETRPFWK